MATHKKIADLHAWALVKKQAWELSCYADFQPRRIVCLVQSEKRWVAISTDAQSFESAVAHACGLPDAHAPSHPWAHGPSMLSAMALNAACQDGTDAQRIDAALHQLGTEHHFGCSPMSNYVRFLAIPQSADLGQAATRCSSLFKQAQLFESQGFDALTFTHAHLPQLPLDFGEAYDRAQGFDNGYKPDPVIQVDGDGQTHWLWFPAAARCLGAPAELSIAKSGLSSLLAWGNITGAANRIASQSPAAFRSSFAEALMAIDEPAQLKSHWIAPPEVSREFILRDMRAALACPKTSPTSVKPNAMRI